MAVAPCSCADSKLKAEYTVKGAYIMNFIDYVEWPSNAFSDKNSPYVICILGKSPFTGTIEKLSDRMVRNRRVTVQYLTGIGELKECHILFISTSEKDRLPKILGSAKLKGVMTVSEIKNFVNVGGIIGFVHQGNNIRFEINSRAAQQAGLAISSYMLNLANTVVN
jgi:hypothetical protein